MTCKPSNAALRMLKRAGRCRWTKQEVVLKLAQNEIKNKLIESQKVDWKELRKLRSKVILIRGQNVSGWAAKSVVLKRSYTDDLLGGELQQEFIIRNGKNGF